MASVSVISAFEIDYYGPQYEGWAVAAIVMRQEGQLQCASFENLCHGVCLTDGVKNAHVTVTGIKILAQIISSKSIGISPENLHQCDDCVLMLIYHTCPSDVCVRLCMYPLCILCVCVVLQLYKSHFLAV